MQNDYLDTQILFHEDDLQNSLGTISGQLIFTPKIDLNVEELGYQVVLIAKNIYLSRDISLQQKILFRNKTMKKGKDYSYDFELTPIFSFPFNSKNLEIEPSIQTIVNLQTSSYLAIRNDYLEKKKLSILTDTNQLLWSNKKISLMNAKGNYLIEEESHNLTNRYLRPWIYFIISSIIAVFISYPLQIFFGNYLLPICLIFLFSIFVVPQLYKEYILKSIGINITQINENQFTIFLDVTKNWQWVQSIKTEYGIFGNILFAGTHENVPYGIDLFISPAIKKSKIKPVEENVLDFQEVNYDFVFNFPKRNLPATFDHPNISTYWEFKITVYFILGLKSEFVKEIKVKRVPANPKTNKR
ncbi:MAG: hypothetical protein AB8H03_00410 [Saprospiraceae bacterium]